MERTLVVLKPDAVQRGIVGEIITRFERAGLKLVAMKMIAPDKEHFHDHYEGISKLISRWGQEVYDITLAHMTESPVVAIVFEGVDAVEHVRKMVGKLDPKESMPGTIRGDFTHVSRQFTNDRKGTLPNIIHASGDAVEAKEEVSLWFSDNEVYDYKTPHEKIIQGSVPELDSKK